MTDHKSDCAVHNEPAMKAGPCDCGTGIVEAMARAIEAAEDAWLVQAGDALDGLQEEPEFSLPETKARAALTAALDHMREPSEAQCEVLWGKEAKDQYRQAINVAIEELSNDRS